MLHCSWDMVCGGCNYFSFSAIFCPFTPNSLKKWKLLKKKKRQSGDVINVHKCTKNYDQMMYDFWDMVRNRCNCYFSFWANFCTFTPLKAQKVKIFEKMKKTPGNIIILQMCTKIMIRWCLVPEICCATDAWTEKVTYRGGCPT